MSLTPPTTPVPPHRLPADALPAAVVAARDAMLADTALLVGTESSSRDLAALAGCREVLEDLVERRLGTPDRRVLHPGGAQGDTLELTYRGSAAGTVLLVGHYDTVWPTGTVAGWPLAPVEVEGRGECLTGPGAVDMKAGLVVAIWSLLLAREIGSPLPTVTLLMNADEEIGSLSSRPVIEEVSGRHDVTLVFEGGLDGAVKTGRKGVGIVEVTCVGIESHAGNFPEQGASAISAMAGIVPRLDALADPDAGTTVNVGTIHGGSGSNVVAGRCTVGVDVRVTSVAEQDRIDAGLADLAAEDPRVRVEVEGRWNRPPMELGGPGAALFEDLAAAADRLGYALQEVAVGGASDANFIAAAGGAVVCGVGPGGGGPHARHEFVEVASILEQTALVREYLRAAGSSGGAGR